MNPQQIIISLGVLVFAVVIHEVAHGWAAWKLGDPTAKELGRITLNPIPHIDLFWTLLFPAMLVFSGSPIVFGGAKPVPFNPRYFKNPLKDTVIVAAAGPISNFVLAIGSWVILFLILNLGGGTAAGISSTSMKFIYDFFFTSVLINVLLACFNLFPVPPLDGGRIAVGLLPSNLAEKLAKLEPYGFIIVIAALYLGVIDSYMRVVMNFVFSIMP